MQRTAGVLGACLFTAAILGNLLAQEAPEAPPSATAPSDEQPTAQIAEEIRQRLHEPITLQLREVPVRDAIEELLTKQKIDYWYDDRALEDESISLDGPEISCNLHNVSIRGALKRILSQAKLSWVCEDAGIRITTEAQATNLTFPRVYEISDLLEEPTVEVVAPPRLSVDQAQFGGLGGVVEGPVTSPEEKAARDDRRAKEAARPENILKKMIMEVTGGPPDGPWFEMDGEGGSIHLIQTAHTKLLIVKQTEQVHADIEDLLNELLSHHHQFDEGMEGAARPKTAARIGIRSPVKVLVKRQSVR